MIRKFYISALASLALLSGCIDDNYDLSNIDTSVEVKVNDLVIPVNLGTVTLNSVINLDEDGSISKEPYNGTDPTLQGKEIYVYNIHGDFTSDPIKVNPFTVDAPRDLTPKIIKVNLADASSAQRRRSPGASLGTFKYDITPTSTDFAYTVDDMDPKITSVDEVVSSKLQIGTSLKVPADIVEATNYITLRNVKVKFPKGLTLKDGKPAKASAGKYDPATGIVTIDTYEAENGLITLILEAQVVDLSDESLQINNGHFSYNSEISLLQGVAYLDFNEKFVSAPQQFDVNMNYDIKSFDISNITGDIDYDIDGLAFEKASLRDMPDFLAQDETAIRLANPQLYISIENSCAPYSLGGFTGLEVTPIRDGVNGDPLKMEGLIKVGSDKGVGPYKFAISPEGNNLKPVEEYSDAEKLMFSSLGDVLYGKGLPQEVQVEFTQPTIDGKATNFPLGTTIPALNGGYLFRAPLALADGSQIVYSGTEEDWNSEALEDLFVSYLTVTADATSTLPLDVTLSAELLNTEKNHMGVCEVSTLPALAENYPITIVITPSEGQDFISGIDGIFYKAWAKSTSPADQSLPLSPEQTIVLKNLRVKVTGKYVKLDDDHRNDYK